MKKKLTYLTLLLVGAIIGSTSTFALIAVDEFPDVDYDSWYGPSVEEMAGRGIISGYENGNFGPDDAVTRAQFVTMLDRYDTEVGYMKTLICDGFDRSDVDNTHIYDELCPPLAE